MQQEANQITSHQDGPVVPTYASCGPDQIDESGYVVTRLDAMTMNTGETKKETRDAAAGESRWGHDLLAYGIFDIP